MACEVAGRYVYACPLGEAIVWNHMPLEVEVGYEQLGVRESLAWWNEALGHEAFVEGCCDVLVAYRPEEGALARTEHFDDLRAVVTVRRQIGPCQLKHVMAHELGHVLGLAHDGVWTSIMYPVINLNGQCSIPKLDADDRWELIRLYWASTPP